MRFVIGLTLLLNLLLAAPSALAKPVEYAVVVSKATAADADWKQVVDALVKKHQAAVIIYDGAVQECLPELRKQFPKVACFVATPTEAKREFVAQVHRLTRKLDDDPFTDVLWGILTGYDAANALRIAQETQPLIITRALGGTEIALDRCASGVYFSELQAGQRVRKEVGKEALTDFGAADSTQAIADALVAGKAELFVTSGHATERDWQIGFRYRNGQFVSKAGALFGVDTAGKKFPIQSDQPRAYLAVGNCLMGHIDGPDAMALAFLNSTGVRQMVGYTVLTWYGYAGWGCLDYFVEQPGRFTMAEAFFANQQALLYRLSENAPELLTKDPAPGTTERTVKLSEKARAAGLTQQDLLGLLHDRDVCAFYGDPAWVAKLAEGPVAWKQSLTKTAAGYEFRLTPEAGEKTFAVVNNNGSQRGGRPIMQFFPQRLKNIQITGGQDLRPLATDNFLLVPLPEKCDPAREYRVTFTADVME